MTATQDSGDDGDDAVWRALSSPVRRRVLAVLAEGRRTTGDLDAAFPQLSRFAVMQHLKVLEEAELVIPRRDGRFIHLNAVPIRRIHRRWVSRYAGRWADALVGLKDELEGEADPGTHGRPGTVA